MFVYSKVILYFQITVLEIVFMTLLFLIFTYNLFIYTLTPPFERCPAINIFYSMTFEIAGTGINKWI